VAAETSQHRYQQQVSQVSVGSVASGQTIIFNSSSIMTNPNDDSLIAQMNASESLTSILTRSSNGSHRQKTLSISSAEEPKLHIEDVADLLHPQYAIITGKTKLQPALKQITHNDQIQYFRRKKHGWIAINHFSRPQQLSFIKR
jgi:hypothetical protein